MLQSRSYQRKVVFLCLILLFIHVGGFFFQQPLRSGAVSPSSFKLFAFKPFIISSYNRRIPILVHEKEAELVKLLQTWTEDEGKFDLNLFDTLIKQKKIFPAGKNADVTGVKDYYGTKPSAIQRLKKKYAPVNVYVNQGTTRKPVLVKLSAAMGSEETKKPEPIETLIESKQAYKNLTELFEVEKRVSNEEALVRVVNTKLEVGSKPWLNWAKYQQAKGEYTLQHAVVEYLSPFSDIQGENQMHRRKAGVVGTQAIGDTARENNPLDELPNRIMHPWPSLQEVYFNCRWPNPHPNIIAPPVWAAKMDMSYYRVNDRIVKENEDGLILGGDMMTWWDALKIAAYGHEGESRDESYQLPHATAHTMDAPIPFYNPVHKSNIPDSDKFPFDEELYELLDLKIDYADREQLAEEVTDDVKAEEEQRKQKLRAMGYNLDLIESSPTQEEEIQRELRRRYNSTVAQMLEYFSKQYEGISEASLRDLSSYELVKQFNLSDEFLAKLPNRQVVWNFFQDGRPDRVDRVVASRMSKTGKEEVITWSPFNETTGAKIENYLKSIEQYYYDDFRTELALKDERFKKEDRGRDEIVSDFVERINQYRAMMALNPNKREQQKKRRMTLVKPSNDPARSYFSQYAPQPKEGEAGEGVVGNNEDFSIDEDVIAENVDNT